MAPNLKTNLTTWLSLQFVIEQNNAELLADILMGFGALAVDLEDHSNTPIYEPTPGTTPLWSTIKIRALFEAQKDIKPIVNYLNNQFSISTNEIKIIELADDDWISKSKNQFKIKNYANRLWICPSWEESPGDSDTTVFIDPGQAFGTGMHPTTGLCLNWLAHNPPQNMTVIDYGCGSGILAIAALKLGAKKAIAIDYDPLAIETTEENCHRNSINPQQITIAQPDHIEAVKADCLIANIVANPLIELATTFKALTKKEGVIVLSGILEEQIDSVLNAYQPEYRTHSKENSDNWILLQLDHTVSNS